MGGSEGTADGLCSAQVSELLQVDLQVLVSSVQQQLQRLTAVKQEVHHLRLRQLQVRQRQAFCRRYQHRLQKVVKLRAAAGGAVLLSQIRASRVLQTLQDLDSVSELLDSCTLVDLGSDLHTSRLLERFSRARPHLTVSPGPGRSKVARWVGTGKGGGTGTAPRCSPQTSAGL